MKQRASLIVVWLALAAHGGTASAATVSVGPSDRFPGLDAIVYVADAGETNSVTVTYGASDDLEIVDAGATITAGPGCTSLAPHTVSCTDPAVFDFKLGDGNDFLSLDVDSTGSVLRGGEGNDRILGGDNSYDDHEYLLGGPGNDVLRGRWGAETFKGGPGADRFSGGTSCDQETAGLCFIHVDTVTYAGRANRVKADADGVADDGERGENDLIRKDVERLVGGRGDDVLGGLTTNFRFDGRKRLVGMQLEGRRGNDVLRGGRARDRLEGGRGNDLLRGARAADSLQGGRGDDKLVGGRGTDWLRGGSGRDWLAAQDRQADRVDGGIGLDVGVIDRALDRVRRVERLF